MKRTKTTKDEIMRTLHLNDPEYLPTLIRSIKNESVYDRVLFNEIDGRIIDYGSQAQISSDAVTGKKDEHTEKEYEEKRKEDNWIEPSVMKSKVPTNFGGLISSWEIWLNELGFSITTKETDLDAKHKTLWEAWKMEEAYQIAQHFIKGCKE